MKKLSNTEAEFKKSVAYKSVYLIGTWKHELNILIAYIPCIYVLFVFLFYTIKNYWSLNNFFDYQFKNVQF